MTPKPTGTAPPEPLSYTMPQLPGVTGLGRTKLYEAIRVGTLPSARVCGRRVVLADDLRQFLRTGDASRKSEATR